MALHDFRYADALRYRNVPEAQVVRFLCSPFEMRRGRIAEETAAMQDLLDHLVGKGLPFRASDGAERRFDLAELVNFIKYAHHAWGEPVWLERGVATMRRLMFQDDPGPAAASPPELSRGLGRRYAVTITRCFAAGFPSSIGTVRLNMPKPLNAVPGSHRADWLRCDGAVQQPRDEGDRYSVKVRADARNGTVVAVRHEFTPAPHVTLPTSRPPPADLYLRPHEGLVVVTPEIVGLAASLGLDAAHPGRTLRRIWDYLSDEVSFGFIHYDRLAAGDPLAWGLAHRRVDCRTGSALIVALCRAAGIPARMVNGYTISPVLPTSHSWVEAWMGAEGWLPFDTYAIDLAGGERNSPWREHFFGQIDGRFVAEVLPLHFCGLGSPRLPPGWQLSMGLTEAGATTWFHALDGFDELYSETVAIELA